MKLKEKQILVALSGSEQSVHACELSWKLARLMNAKVLAQHIVDLPGAWEFLGYDKPGLIGVDPYFDAHEHLCRSLSMIANQLVDAYEKRASDERISTKTIVDTGNPAECISERAKQCDFVVIGHKSRNMEMPEPPCDATLMRLSVAEQMAHLCAKPLIVVQDKSFEWLSMAILISSDHINELYINACLKMAQLMSLQPLLICLTSSARKSNAQNLITELREANQLLSNVPIAVTSTLGCLKKNEAIEWYAKDNNYDWANWLESLVVVPSREINGKRITIFGGSTTSFIRYLNLPAILLWPEESINDRSEQTKLNMTYSY
jgi:nucleotide-binding universal stress UspA family protein